MTKKELQTMKEMIVVSVMDLLRRGRIDKSTPNQDVVNMVWDELPANALRLEWGNLLEIVKTNCVKRIYKDDLGRLKADVRKFASGTIYEATEGDIIVTPIGEDESKCGFVLPSEDNIND